MSATALIVLALKISVALTVLALGLRATRQDAVSLFRQPGLLLRSLVSMNIVMPILAVALALGFDLPPAAKLALVAISVSPVPPFLPRKQLAASSDAAYTIGLLVTTCVLAIAVIPLSIGIIARLTGKLHDVPAGAIAAVVSLTVLLPIAAGILLRSVFPDLIARLARPVSRIATALLIFTALPLMLTLIPEMLSLIGNGTLAAMTVFVVVGLGAGHLLGGPDSDKRPVLALATAARHPGMALAIAHITHPEVKLAAAAVVLYLLLNGVLSKLYLSWWSARCTRDAGMQSAKTRHA
jgi:BASS family bile acid:Na+ symporter